MIVRDRLSVRHLFVAQAQYQIVTVLGLVGGPLGGRHRASRSAAGAQAQCLKHDASSK